jgi:SAM-dependent methyltransferase
VREVSSGTEPRLERQLGPMKSAEVDPPLTEGPTTVDSSATDSATTQTLTIHIGASKTGTSAIQAFLMRNRDWLRKRGIVVPDVAMGDGPVVRGYQVFYFERLGADPTQSAAELAKNVEALFARDGVRQVVISAENLSSPDAEALRWFDDVVSQHETEVVIYLRRQDDYLLSSWQQWFAKVEPDLWTWLTSCAGVRGDWRAVLEQWERLVGRERIRVRLYERDRLVDGDVVADFAQFLRVDESIPDEAPEETVNPSFNEAIVSLIPGSGLFKDGHDDEFYDFLDELLGAASHKRPNESGITYLQRMEILEHYEEANSWVRERYFADSDVPSTLFEMPSPNDYRVPSESELAREQMQMLFRLVFEVHKRKGGSSGSDSEPSPEDSSSSVTEMATTTQGPTSRADLVTWDGPNTFVLDGVRFRLDLGRPETRTPSSDEEFCLVKSRDFVETYGRLEREKPQHVLELGIYQGGSLVFFERLFRPERIVGIDISPDPIPALDRYVERGSVIRPYLGTSQDDKELLDEILSREFPQGIDLIVDDASHRYEPSRRSFEICFPYLKPGGVYVLEDWSWSLDAGTPTALQGPELLNLVCEWVVSIAGSGAIAELTVLPKLTILRKSHSAALR